METFMLFIVILCYVFFFFGIYVAFYVLFDDNVFLFLICGFISLILLLVAGIISEEIDKATKYEYYLNDVKHEIKYPDTCDTSKKTCNVDNVTIKVDNIKKISNFDFEIFQ